MDSNYVYSEIAQMSARACQKMNEFSSEILGLEAAESEAEWVRFWKHFGDI